MTDYKKVTPENLSKVPTGKANHESKSAVMRAQRRKYEAMRQQNLTIADICHNMSGAELARNAKRGGVAAIAEEAFRAGQPDLAEEMRRAAQPDNWDGIIKTDPELDIGV